MSIGATCPSGQTCKGGEVSSNGKKVVQCGCHTYNYNSSFLQHYTRVCMRVDYLAFPDANM